MNFLSPLAFLFALSLPAVVVFYLLRRKRVVKLVPSTLLWQEFLAETQASAPLQRLRRNWLLFLQLLLLLLVVLALARPYFAGQTGEAALQIVILDASASMQATDETPSRFEKARSGALRLVDGLKTGLGKNSQQMLVMVAGANAEVRQSATSEKSALRRAVESAQVTDSRTRLADALRVAETLTRDMPNAEIHLFSDGAGVELSEFASKDLRLVFHRVGTRGNNLGIVTLDVKPNPEDPAKRAIFTSVANFSGAAADTTVELLFDGQLVETKPVTVTPTNTAPVVFVAAQPRDGVFTVRLTAKDDLAADNQASVVSRLPQPVRVLLVTKGNRFLEKALAGAAPNVELATVPDFTDVNVKFDLIVLDDVPPTAWPTGNLFAIHVANTNWFESGIGEVEAPPIVDWKNTHPLLRFVNFDNVQIASSLAVKTPSWAVALVDSPSSPLVLAGELGRQRLVWVGFDTLQSTWPLRISFPIFIANAVDWLNPATAKADQFLIRAGDAFRLPLGDLGQPASAKVTLPDGTVKDVSLGPQARELVFGETAQQGTYRVALGTNQLAFCANLLDAAESDITPRNELSLGRRGEVVATPLKRANLEYWRWFAAAAFAVLMAEWWWFHRRTA
jgi:Ca-activated chloride channel homolog